MSMLSYFAQLLLCFVSAAYCIVMLKVFVIHRIAFYILIFNDLLLQIMLFSLPKFAFAFPNLFDIISLSQVPSCFRMLSILIKKSYQFINVVNGVSHSHKTAHTFFNLTQ